jgi:phosphoglycolate phosphatase-like HAD superfamily hydrolase
MTTLEIINPQHPFGPFKAVVIDFDGTISLLRRDWQGVMNRQMVAALAGTGTSESPAELHAIADDIIFRLTGQPTIVQMQALADEVRRRTGRSREPLEYFLDYDEQLMGQARGRIEAVQSGKSAADDFLVAGARALIESLQHAGLLLVLASGTDLTHVRTELAILGLNEQFGGRVYAPLDSDPHFSKLGVMQRLLEEHNLTGNQIVAIGDGATEIEAIKSLGGLAIGVASNEVTLRGIDPRKRASLLRAGADVIIPDYRELDEIMRLVGSQ